MYLIYYWLYFLSICLLELEYDWWNYYHYMIICYNTRSNKVACGTIWGCATNKNYCYINVVCIQTVTHWGTNQECSINQGNTIYSFTKLFFTKIFIHSLLPNIIVTKLSCYAIFYSIWLKDVFYKTWARMQN